MGAYLSSPVTEKISSDEKSSERLSCGFSSMQGWRVSQEDAHNCIVDFDQDGSFFAVYDGHGGAEVAKYCALHFPDCLRSVVSYKNGNISQALEEAFLEFDNCLTKPEVIDELKHLSMVSDGSEDEDTVVEDSRALNEEAQMPLEQLLARYKGAPVPLKICTEHIRNYHNQKPKSPMLHAKKAPDAKDDSVRPLVNGEDNCPPKLDLDPATNGKEEGGAGGEATEQTGGRSGVDEAAGDDVAEPGCSHPTERTKRKKCTTKSETPSGDASDDEDEDEDEEYSVGDSSSSSEEDEEKENEEEEETTDEESEEDSSDEDVRLEVAEDEEPGKDSGCTAVVAVLSGNQLYVANAGDSRCVVSRGGKALDMSFDHKPEDPVERTRIEKAGGEVTADGRVNGGLNLSRAIGDHSYKNNEALGAKEQMISAQPDIQTLTIDPEEDCFMVLACDGIWNTMSSQEVIDFVDKRLKEGKLLSGICEELFDHCLAPDTAGDGTGCDNMTCIIVKFRDIPTSEDKKRQSERQAEGAAKKQKTEK